MNRLALWIVCICAGVLVHLALAFAYWAELDGESRYDLGGAFMGNMQVSIMPDMGQGIAGGDTDNLQNNAPDETQSDTSSVQEPSDTESDALTDPASTKEQAIKPDSKQPEPLSEQGVAAAESIEPVELAIPEAEEKVAPQEEAAPVNEVARAGGTDAETEPTFEAEAAKEPEAVVPEAVVPEPEVEPISKAQLEATTEPDSEAKRTAEEAEHTTDSPAKVSRPASSPAPVLVRAQEEAPPQDKEEEPAKHVSLMKGGALAALPASAPRHKIATAPASKGMRVAQKTRSSSASRKASASGKRAGSSGNSGKASVRGDGGISDKAGGAGSRGVRASYATQLRRWIERHKRYPRSAKMRGVQGQGVVRIVINRSGRVLKSTLVKSAGDRYLDDEIRSLPMRASPAPKPPKQFSGARHTLTLPVRFSR
nr:TonB family protein [uncultured Cohaesibacter sp.]